MILTYTGRLVDPLNLQPEDVCLEDMVWSLSWINRFVGHAHTPVSVLFHSILVAMGLPRPIKVYGLGHDFGESYIGDINRTVKHASRVIVAAEKRAMWAIWEGLGVPQPTKAILAKVKKADDRALAIEGTSFHHPNWRTRVPEFVADDERAFPMTPLETRRAFMVLWTEHGPGKVRVA